jgi:hypothetical protein
MSDIKNYDVRNLRLYASLFRENKWETDALHWNVFEATLNEIADSIARLEDDKQRLDGLLKLAQESFHGRVELHWDKDDEFQPWSVAIPGDGSWSAWDDKDPRAAIDAAMEARP